MYGCARPYSYAALDARVLLSIAAVLDQQLCDGVVARNELRRSCMRTLAPPAESVAAAAREAQDAQAPALALRNARDDTDDDNSSVCSDNSGRTESLTSDRALVYEDEEHTEREETKENDGLTPMPATVEAVTPALHCYLPCGKDFVQS